MSDIETLSQEISQCQGCILCKTRTKAVPGTGPGKADIMIVGEAPGADEDRTGLPFVGRSGELVTLALNQAGLLRSNVFITNLVKCNPPGNRNPSQVEIDSCEVYLWLQIEMVRPKLIMALGKIASQFLLGREVKITKEHGHLHFPEFADAVMTLYHPAYVLRNRGTPVEENFKTAFKDAYKVVYG